MIQTFPSAAVPTIRPGKQARVQLTPDRFQSEPYPYGGEKSYNPRKEHEGSSPS